MPNSDSQSVAKRFFSSRLFLIILLIIAVLVALNFARAYYQDIKIRDEIKLLEKEVKNLEQKKIESLSILEYVTSDAFVEEKARTELNLRKPGEKVAVVEQAGESGKRNINSPQVKIEHLGNPTKWWYYFIHQYSK